LEDYCQFPVSKAAFFLSIMAIVAAIFNIVNASVCKLCHNHRVLFLKGAAIVTVLCMTALFIMLYYDIRSALAGIIFFIIAGNASISSLLIPVIQQSNTEDVSVTAVSIMNFCFFLLVGFLGTLTGFLLNIFEPQRINGVLVYGRESYLLLFGTFLLLSVFELYKALKLYNQY
jgi:hypothetical protein